MRFVPRLVCFGGLGAVLALAMLPRRRPRAEKSGSPTPLDEPLPNRPDPPRGAKTVMVLVALSAAVLAGGLTWYGFDQSAQTRAVALALTHGSPEHAPSLFTRYGCAGCHTIPGAPGADGQVGPDLSGLKERVYIGGVLRNTPDNLVQWIVNPQRSSPHSAMPVTGISEAEARDAASYLYSR